MKVIKESRSTLYDSNGKPVSVIREKTKPVIKTSFISSINEYIEEHKR